MHNAPMLLVIDLIGVFVFALAGATAAVRQRLDLFGVLVLSFATATPGGILRDLLIGAVPPAAFHDWRYLAAAMLAGLVTFIWHRAIERLRNPVRVFDAARPRVVCRRRHAEGAGMSGCIRSWPRCSACSRASAAA